MVWAAGGSAERAACRSGRLLIFGTNGPTEPKHVYFCSFLGDPVFVDATSKVCAAAVTFGKLSVFVDYGSSGSSCLNLLHCTPCSNTNILTDTVSMASHFAASRTIDLSHIKTPRAGNGNGSSVNARVAFWGAVKSNKDEATVRFLLRKAASEGGLTKQQEGLLLAAQQRLALQGKPAVPSTPTTPSGDGGAVSSHQSGIWGRAAMEKNRKPTSGKQQGKGVKGGSKRPRSSGGGAASAGRRVVAKMGGGGPGGVSISLTPGSRSVQHAQPEQGIAGRKFAQGSERRRRGGGGGQTGATAPAANTAFASPPVRVRGGCSARDRDGVQRARHGQNPRQGG